MIVIKTPTSDPHLNLAIEEYLLRRIVEDEAILMFYVNEPSVIVGRNQNVFQEVNYSFVNEMEIPVIRRLSGGGTVYHDPGNLNYCLITPGQGMLNDYAAFTEPVRRAIEAVNLAPSLRHRSSIFVLEKKVSGNAQYASGSKLLSHGTLLIDADLGRLQQAVAPSLGEVSSRAIRSVRSSVANLVELAKEPLSTSTMLAHLQSAFLGSTAPKSYQLTDADWEAVTQLADSRYRSWSWNVARSPACIVYRRVQKKSLRIAIEEGCISSVEPAESVPHGLASDLNLCLRGVRFDRRAVEAALTYCSMLTMPPGVSRDELADVLTGYRPISR
ncbi:MAG: biotin/lipoate A/B protein ligase family protein [Candidatus Promineifilaceae bacterium]